MIRIAFIRHGTTAWNRAGRIQGRSDIPLEPQARAEFAALTLPPEWHDAQVWASPLSRACQTAQALTGQPPLQAPDLIEMNWGDFEGLRGKDLIQDPNSGYRHLEDWGWSFRPPNGETPREVADRVANWMHGQTKDAVAICHIGTIRAALALAHGWDFTGPAPFRIKRKRLYGLTLHGTTITPSGEVRLPAKTAMP